MDMSLIAMLVISVGLVAWQAPYAVLTLFAIIMFTAIFVRGAWSFLQGFGKSVPEAERVRSDR